jgi:hypothetical protein
VLILEDKHRSVDGYHDYIILGYTFNVDGTLQINFQLLPPEACIWVMPSERTAQGQRIDRVILYTHTSHNGFLSVASNRVHASNCNWGSMLMFMSLFI